MIRRPVGGSLAVSLTAGLVSVVACVEGPRWLYLAPYLPDVSLNTSSTGAANLFLVRTAGNWERHSAADKTSNYLCLHVFPRTVSYFTAASLVASETQTSFVFLFSFLLPRVAGLIWYYSLEVCKVSTDPSEPSRMH